MTLQEEKQGLSFSSKRFILGAKIHFSLSSSYFCDVKKAALSKASSYLFFPSFFSLIFKSWK
jgi:hypothetical protein